MYYPFTPSNLPILVPGWNDLIRKQVPQSATLAEIILALKLLKLRVVEDCVLNNAYWI